MGGTKAVEQDPYWTIAVHESAHAVVAALRGVPFVEPGITCTISSRGEVDAAVHTKILSPSLLERFKKLRESGDESDERDALGRVIVSMLLVKLSGDIAQTIFAPNARAVVEDHSDDNRGIDELLTALCAEEDRSEECAAAIAGAEKMVRDNRRRILKLAGVLVRKKGNVPAKKLSAIMNLPIMVLEREQPQEDKQ